MIQGRYVRVHVGPVDVAEASASQLLLMIESIGRKLAHIFLKFGGQMGIREKREAVLCGLPSASRHSNV
jgi:hypothetical protein